MHSTSSENEKAGPDDVKSAQHVRDTLGYSFWEKLLFNSINHVLLNIDIVWVAQKVHNDAEEEASKAEPADDESTDQADSVLQMTPASLEDR